MLSALILFCHAFAAGDVLELFLFYNPLQVNSRYNDSGYNIIPVCTYKLLWSRTKHDLSHTILDVYNIIRYNIILVTVIRPHYRRSLINSGNTKNEAGPCERSRYQKLEPPGSFQCTSGYFKMTNNAWGLHCWDSCHK